MLKIDGEICKVQLISGPTNFRTITVKLYLQPELTEELAEEPTEELAEELAEEPTEELAEEPAEELVANVPCRRSKRIQRLPTRLQQNTADVLIFINDTPMKPDITILEYTLLLFIES